MNDEFADLSIEGWRVPVDRFEVWNTNTNALPVATCLWLSDLSTILRWIMTALNVVQLSIESMKPPPLRSRAEASTQPIKVSLSSFFLFQHHTQTQQTLGHIRSNDDRSNISYSIYDYSTPFTTAPLLATHGTVARSWTLLGTANQQSANKRRSVSLYLRDSQYSSSCIGNFLSLFFLVSYLSFRPQTLWFKE